MTDAVPPRGDKSGSDEGNAPGASPASEPRAAVPARQESAAPEQMRASDADREQVVDRLRQGLAEGRIDMAEFEERLDVAYKAKTYGELAPVVRDLPVTGSGQGRALLEKRPAGEVSDDWSARIGGTPTSGGAFALWSGFDRKGRWTCARKFTAFAMFGGGDIDLREARFEGRETSIRCFTVMGGMGVVVPPGMNVEVRGAALMGGIGRHGAGEGDPDAPRVRITAYALMGGIGVRRKERKRRKNDG